MRKRDKRGTYGQVTVLREVDRPQGGNQKHRYWECLCKCGRKEIRSQQWLEVKKPRRCQVCQDLRLKTLFHRPVRDTSVFTFVSQEKGVLCGVCKKCGRERRLLRKNVVHDPSKYGCKFCYTQSPEFKKDIQGRRYERKKERIQETLEGSESWEFISIGVNGKLSVRCKMCNRLQERTEAAVRWSDTKYGCIHCSKRNKAHAK